MNVHPTQAEPIEEYALIHWWGSIRIQVISPGQILIQVPLVNLFHKLSVTLDEALWLSSITALCLELTDADNQPNGMMPFRVEFLSPGIS